MAAMSNFTVIDDKVFGELKENVGADFIGELIDTYLTDAPRMLAEMHQALATGDAEGFRRAAHSFKSNSATFGALTLSVLAKELEMMGKSGALEGAPVKVTQLEAEYNQVRDGLEKLK
jgi:HPt (histidine-containing phosphotransfer) domain-containing protein